MYQNDVIVEKWVPFHILFEFLLYFIIVETPPTFQPYIDKVYGHLGVALGGNGFAAKSCNEIGRLAAGMMFDEWNSKLPREVFKFRTRDRKYRDTKSKL